MLRQRLRQPATLGALARSTGRRDERRRRRTRLKVHNIAGLKGASGTAVHSRQPVEHRTALVTGGRRLGNRRVALKTESEHNTVPPPHPHGPELPAAPSSQVTAEI